MVHQRQSQIVSTGYTGERLTVVFVRLTTRGLTVSYRIADALELANVLVMVYALYFKTGADPHALAKPLGRENAVEYSHNDISFRSKSNTLIKLHMPLDVLPCFSALESIKGVDKCACWVLATIKLAPEANIGKVFHE